MRIFSYSRRTRRTLSGNSLDSCLKQRLPTSQSTPAIRMELVSHLLRTNLFQFTTISLLASHRASIVLITTQRGRVRSLSCSMKCQLVIRRLSIKLPTAGWKATSWLRAISRAVVTRGGSSTDRSMGSASSSIRMAGGTRASGGKAGWRALGSCTINQTGSPTRESGSTTSSQGGGSSTMSIPSH